MKKRERMAIFKIPPELSQTPGMEIVRQLRTYFLAKWKVYALFFLLGFTLAFPFTKEVIAWLIDENRLPNNVNILVTTPVELIVLQVRISANVGLVCVVLFALYELIRYGRHHQAVQQRLQELNIAIPSQIKQFVPHLLVSFGLGVMGLWYSWTILVPMLLDYLTQDAQGIGLSTEWRLQSYVGFLFNLVIASVIGFQTPLFTRALIRYNIVQLKNMKQYRRHIWFAAFVAGAFLSPPDPLSLFLVAMPIIIFFELTISMESIIQIPGKSSA
jgi:sec-independent protein translocase protein TatC